MSDVLVASLIGEGTRVYPLVEGLRAAGLSVWWDGDLTGGEHRRRTIASELEAARCVVVVWTTASVGPNGELVQDIAAHAKERGILLPVLLDPVTQPLGFRQIQPLDLVHWNGRLRNRRFKKLVAAARAIVSGNLRAQPQAKRRLLRWLVGAAVAIPPLSVLGFLSDLHELHEPVCQQIAGIRTVCAHLGLGGVPTPKEEEAWAERTRKPGDCSVLREYLSEFPVGSYAEEAERRLLAAETEVTVRWEAQEHSLPLTVRARHEPLPSEAEARSDALARASAEAKFVCAGYKGDSYRLGPAIPNVVEWRCSPSRGGFICGFDGQAICKVKARKTEQRQVCRDLAPKSVP